MGDEEARVVGEMSERLRASDVGSELERQLLEARDRLIGIGAVVVPALLYHLRTLADDWPDYDASGVEPVETFAFMGALARIDDVAGKEFVVSCAADIVSVVHEPDDAMYHLGYDAIHAMAGSHDPVLHDLLVRWVAGLEPESARWWNLWWLIDSARPFLDERACPALGRLVTSSDPDISRSARQALATVKTRGTA